MSKLKPAGTWEEKANPRVFQNSKVLLCCKSVLHFRA